MLIQSIQIRFRFTALFVLMSCVFGLISKPNSVPANHTKTKVEKNQGKENEKVEKKDRVEKKAATDKTKSESPGASTNGPAKISKSNLAAIENYSKVLRSSNIEPTVKGLK